MELRPTGNPGTNNTVAMSMLEYLISKRREIVATRNILHISKLQEFEGFLESKRYMIVATSKNPHEVLRAQKDGDTVIVYKKKDAKEHLTTMDKDYHLVREFIENQNTRTIGDKIRSMNNEEMAQFASEHFFVGHGKSQILEWLKQPAEDL